MKALAGHEELWAVILDGHGLHGDPIEIDLPDDVLKRCQAAQAEWEACLDILAEAYEAAGGDKKREEQAPRMKLDPEEQRRADEWKAAGYPD